MNKGTHFIGQPITCRMTSLPSTGPTSTTPSSRKEPEKDRAKLLEEQENPPTQLSLFDYEDLLL